MSSSSFPIQKGQLQKIHTWTTLHVCVQKNFHYPTYTFLNKTDTEQTAHFYEIMNNYFIWNQNYFLVQSQPDMTDYSPDFGFRSAGVYLFLRVMLANPLSSKLFAAATQLIYIFFCCRSQKVSPAPLFLPVPLLQSSSLNP